MQTLTALTERRYSELLHHQQSTLLCRLLCILLDCADMNVAKQASYTRPNKNQSVPKLNYVFGSVAVFLLLLTGISCSRVTNTAGIDVYDSFETADLNKVWDTDRFEPGAVQMQTNIVRAGHGAARVVVHAKDKFEVGINGDRDSERDELLEAKELTSKENQVYEFSWSMFIPPDLPIVPTRLVIAQWKQQCPHGGICQDNSPVVAIRYASGEVSTPLLDQ
jgi:hypothetical protein